MAFFSLGDDPPHEDDIGTFSHWLDDGGYYADRKEDEEITPHSHLTKNDIKTDEVSKIKRQYAKSKSKKRKRFNKTKT